MVHAISLPPGCFGGGHIDDLFLGRLDPAADAYFARIAGLRVSAHFLIRRAGSVTQYVPVLARAWHAGESQWRGKTRCNDFSVGVELEGDDKTPFTTIQYRQLARLFRTLQTRLPLLKNDHMAGHQEIAPGRKWDPGPCFDWPRLWQETARAVPEPSWPLIWE